MNEKETIQFDRVTEEKGLIVLHSHQGLRIYMTEIDAIFLAGWITDCIEALPEKK